MIRRLRVTTQPLRYYSINHILRQEAGCTTKRDYTEQASWLFFLKYLEDLQKAFARRIGLPNGISGAFVGK
ncbi:MAG: hypothetical protein L3J22_02860 [Xanthomonadales bacterium]|nr:hypothetical protein [Xanthomonadales bacterium]